MKAQQAIELLQRHCNPDDDIIIDFWTIEDFAHLYVGDDETDTMTADEWKIVVQKSEKLEWYTELQDLVHDVFHKRGVLKMQEHIDEYVQEHIDGEHDYMFAFATEQGTHDVCLQCDCVRLEGSGKWEVTA